jgi:hypothetical protein
MKVPLGRDLPTLILEIELLKSSSAEDVFVLPVEPCNLNSLRAVWLVGFDCEVLLFHKVRVYRLGKDPPELVQIVIYYRYNSQIKIVLLFAIILLVIIGFILSTHHRRRGELSLVSRMRCYCLHMLIVVNLDGLLHRGP